MKNLFVLFVLVATVFACNSIEQHRVAIEEVSTMWSDMTPKMEEMMTGVSELNTNWESMASMLTPVTEDMDETAAAELVAMNQEYKDNAMAVKGMMEEMQGYMTGMTEKGSMVQSMVDGLASGSIEGDVVSMVADAKAMMEEANTKMADWSTKMGDYKTMAAQMAAKFAPEATEGEETGEM